MISLAVAAAGWVGGCSPGDYAAFKFPPLPRHDLDMTPDEVAAVFLEFICNPGTGEDALDHALSEMSFSFGTATSSGEDAAFFGELVAARNASQRNRFRLNAARSRGEARKEMGTLDRRRELYRTLGVEFEGRLPGLPDSLPDLLENPPPDWPKKLKNKMVALEFDADGLGTALGGKGFADFKAASEQQDRLMSNLIQALVDGLSGNGSLELETLLYAGDEGIVVFPAWHLQKVVRIVAEHLCGPEAMTTFSVGMVVCGVKTPILAVRNLTGELIRAGKLINLQKGTPESRLQYLVLGDMDMPAESVETYRRAALGLKLPEQNQVFALGLAAFSWVLDHLQSVKTRRPHKGAPASHSKVRSAIDRVNMLRDSTRGEDGALVSASVALTGLRHRLGNSEVVADRATAEVLEALSPGASEHPDSDGLPDLAVLLHAGALLPLLPETGVNQDDPDGAGHEPQDDSDE